MHVVQNKNREKFAGVYPKVKGKSTAVKCWVLTGLRA